MRIYVLVFLIYWSSASANTVNNFALDDLLKSQSILLDTHSIETNESIDLSLSKVSYQIAQLLYEQYLVDKEYSLAIDAIDSLDIAISIYPENKSLQLLKGDLYYAIKEYEAFYLSALAAYEKSEDKIFESKPSFVSLTELYLQLELYEEALAIVNQMLTVDPEWLLNYFFDMTIAIGLMANGQKEILSKLSNIEKKYVTQIPNIYLAQSLMHLSLNEYASVQSAYKKYQASKLFGASQDASKIEESIEDYLNLMAGLNE